jgi:subtilisin family serine protease
MKNKITKSLNLLMLLLSLSLYSQNFEELKKTVKPSEPTFVYERPKNCALNTSFLMMDLKQNKDIEYLKNRYSLNEIDNNLYVGAFLKIDKTVFNKTDVESLGVKLNTEAGNFFTALIPINNLESLFEVEGIVSVEIAEKVHSTMDSARALTNVNQVHAGTGLPQAYTGNGVIVGVIDDGFDYTHPNFRNLSTQQTRISKVWEQSGVTTAPRPYGTEYVGSPAILNKMRDKINESHGTHVTGIAAGNGGATNSLYRGVAFDSEIVLVSTKNRTDTEILDGIQYIFQQATIQNKPAVINMSLGKHVGPHDGTSAFDSVCNSIIGPGKILVGSAGNEGSKEIHLSKTFTTTNNFCYSFIDNFLQNNLNTNGVSLIDVWGEVGKNFEISINVVKIVNNQIQLINYTPYYSTSVNNPSISTTLQDSDTSSSVDVTQIEVLTETNSTNQKPHAMIFINNSAQDDNNHYILFEIKSSNGTVNSWITPLNPDLTNSNRPVEFTNFGSANTSFVDGDTNMTVGEVGGTGNSIISVGAYTSKNTWTSFSGQSQSLNLPNQNTPNVLNQIADFSSKGPTADGRIKPDITAPGNILASSVSRFDSNYLFTSPRTISGLTDGTNNWFFGMMEGTSMSSPMVAGIIALWLQANPNLTVAQIKTILQNTSITDSFTGTGSAIPNNTWGRGKINAYTGIQYINQFLNVDTFDTTNNFIVYPNPTSSKVYFDNSNFNFKEVAIYNYLGQEVAKTSFSNNINNQEIDMSNLATGVYVLKFSDGATSKSVKVVKQ